MSFYNFGMHFLLIILVMVILWDHQDFVSPPFLFFFLLLPGAEGVLKRIMKRHLSLIRAIFGVSRLSIFCWPSQGTTVITCCYSIWFGFQLLIFFFPITDFRKGLQFFFSLVTFLSSSQSWHFIICNFCFATFFFFFFCVHN